MQWFIDGSQVGLGGQVSTQIRGDILTPNGQQTELTGSLIWQTTNPFSTVQLRNDSFDFNGTPVDIEVISVPVTNFCTSIKIQRIG